MKDGRGVEAERIASTSGFRFASSLDSPVYSSVVKRGMDLGLASLALLFLLPLLAVIAAGIRLGGAGPVIFRQKRCGANGRFFDCYKFRTMRPDAAERLEALLASNPAAAAEWALYQKLKSDPRITPFGRFLRRTSLDELPQLINILRGDMSIIGPRPITSGEIFRYGADFGYYTAVRPGVLGLWQVNGRNSLTYDQRVRMDVEYVRTWSVWKDLRILVKAIPAVMFGSDAY
jgi:lipopolysaccharide/colanic/teichoic acid biosynthesis glycosyltransferase